jgi:dTDP-4-amino-4,6-dideoxy-D-galactose acyltransferase
MLIVLNKASSVSLKDSIYKEMAIFFHNLISCSEIYQYINDEELVNKVKNNHHKRLILPSSIGQELCIKLHDLKVVQILIGSNNELIDFVDIVIDPLEELNLKYFYGKNFLPKVLLDGKFSLDIAKHYNTPLVKLKEMIEHNDAEETLFEIVSLIYKMEWDSDFFNSNIAYLSSICLTKNIENYVKNFTKINDIELIQFRCNCHDINSVQIAEKNLYSFVDIRLTMEKSIDENSFASETKKGIYLRRAVEADIASVVQCGSEIYYSSRYYYDKNFDTEKVDDFYSGWIKKSILGSFDDFCYALYDDYNPIGFCSIKLNNKYSASIGLLGINPNYSKLGLGIYMLNKVIEALYEDGVTYISVVTQGRNYQAQRLYQRCGFITKSTELWYHKWLNRLS